WLAVGSVTAEPTLWDVATGREVRRFSGVSGAILPAFSPDGRTLAAATNSCTVVLWDVESGRLLPASADPPLVVRDLQYRDGGRQLLGIAERLTAWDPATGRELRRYPEVQTQYGVTALSPDGRLLAGIDADGAVRLWDASTGAVVRTFRGP